MSTRGTSAGSPWTPRRASRGTRLGRGSRGLLRRLLSRPRALPRPAAAARERPRRPGNSAAGPDPISPPVRARRAVRLPEPPPDGDVVRSVRLSSLGSLRRRRRDAQRRGVQGQHELADRRVGAQRLGRRAARLLRGGASSRPGSISGPTRYGASASCAEPEPWSCSAIEATEPSTSSAAAITGTASRAASSMPVIPAAWTASSPPTVASTMPSAAVATVNSLARSARARPASDSRTCRASASSGCGPSTSVSSACVPLSSTASPYPPDQRAVRPASSGTTTADGPVGSATSRPAATACSKRATRSAALWARTVARVGYSASSPSR